MEIGKDVEAAALKQAKTILKNILANEIVPKAEEILKQHISSDVYGAYSPRWYVRTGELLGSVTHRKLSDTSYLVYSSAASSPSWVNGMIISGDGDFLKVLNDNPGPIWTDGFPRPAIDNAQREVDEIIMSTLASHGFIQS